MTGCMNIHFKRLKKKENNNKKEDKRVDEKVTDIPVNFSFV